MKKTDIKIIIFILIAAGIGLLFMFALGGDVTYAVVQSQGEEVLRMPLDGSPREQTIQTDDGYNTVVIGNGEAWVKSADCPDMLCVGQGKISKPGQSAVCLPHRMILRIEGGDSEVDSIVE